LGNERLRRCPGPRRLQGSSDPRRGGPPLRLTLRVPGTAPQFAPRIEVVENQPSPHEKLLVRSTEETVTVLYDFHPLCVATRLPSWDIVLRADLRPLGMLIYDDALGLHVGGTTFAKNTFSRLHTAINLG
jgi:hypothetical protein